ncbi:uncharacterized protein LOC118196052 [Stegodyphus dumicola]|uniref:uncharacterized protein LOC118196052 n=1 Tax=Stegodyphus dumicola TaxID=202533 RepID=UPI0015B31FA6|nr:uncharacterized protein LOC118196052 [Stegodyphus dumicola]
MQKLAVQLVKKHLFNGSENTNIIQYKVQNLQRRTFVRTSSRSNSNATAADHKCENCLICRDRQANTRLIPCGHECLCFNCIKLFLKYDKKRSMCGTNINNYSRLP